MANVTTKYTIAINKMFKGKMPRGQVGVVGSFFSFRVEDKDGTVPLKIFQEASVEVGKMLHKDGLVKDIRPASIGFLFDGCVSNWLTH